MTDVPGTLKKIPGGFSTLSGGTRSKMKFWRPFQMPLEGLINTAKCIFCNMTPEKLAEETFRIPGVEERPGWRRLNNIFTPHPEHRLIIPTTCWSTEKLQRWGGTSALYDAFMMGADEVGRGNEKVFLIHVGVQAGQNSGHPHTHVLKTLEERPLAKEVLYRYAENRELYIFSSESFEVFAEGARAGECLIIPTERYFNDGRTFSALASVLSELIELCNRAFKSDPMGVMVNTETGQIVVPAVLKDPEEIRRFNDDIRDSKIRLELRQLPPPYGIAVRIDRDGLLRYASYAPDLHCWGPLERCVSIFERAPFVLPWPHELTAQHLRAQL
jgi:hypothetical protein